MDADKLLSETRERIITELYAEFEAKKRKESHKKINVIVDDFLHDILFRRDGLIQKRDPDNYKAKGWNVQYNGFKKAVVEGYRYRQHDYAGTPMYYFLQENVPKLRAEHQEQSKNNLQQYAFDPEYVDKASESDIISLIAADEAYNDFYDRINNEYRKNEKYATSSNRIDEVLTKEDAKDTIYDKILRKLKNNKLIAYPLVIVTIIGGVYLFLNSIKGIRDTLIGKEGLIKIELKDIVGSALDSELKAELLDTINAKIKTHKVKENGCMEISSVGDSKSMKLAHEIEAFLRAEKFNVNGTVTQIYWSSPPKGIIVEVSNGCVLIIVGYF